MSTKRGGAPERRFAPVAVPESNRISATVLYRARPNSPRSLSDLMEGTRDNIHIHPGSLCSGSLIETDFSLSLSLHPSLSLFPHKIFKESERVAVGSVRKPLPGQIRLAAGFIVEERIGVYVAGTVTRAVVDPRL